MCAFEWEASGAQVFFFCNGKVKTLRIDNIWNFATFNLYTVPAKILYRQRYSYDFRNLGLCSKMLRVGIWMGSFRYARYFTFAMATWRWATFILPRCVHQQKSYISKGIQPIFENSARRCSWAFWKVSGARYFLLQWQWKLCAWTTFEILPRSTCTLCQQNHIPPKVFNRFSKSLCSKMFWVGIWMGSFRCTVFFFCNGKVKTLRIEQHFKFCHIHVYTVSYISFAMARNENFDASTIFEILPRFSKMLEDVTLCQQKSYICQRYSYDFRSLCLSSKMFRLAMDSFASFAMARWKLCAEQHLKVCHIQRVPCARAFNRFSKSLARRCSVRAFEWEVSQVFYFCTWQGENFALRQHLRVCHIWKFATFNVYTVPAKILYLQIHSTDFRNLCLSSKMFNVGIWMGSFRCTGIFLWTWQGENFAHRQHLKVCHFQPVHCAAKILYLQMHSTDFRNL